MLKFIFTCLFFGLLSFASFAESDCRSLMKGFISRGSPSTTSSIYKDLGFSEAELQLISAALKTHKYKVSEARVKSYLTYVLSVSDKQRKTALLDLEQLDQWESPSPHIKKFLDTDKKISKKILAKKITDPKDQQRYTELYYGCRALRPNDVNKNAAKDFKRFNFALNLGTLGASYAFYNMDKDINGEWFKKLGYEVGITVLFTYVGGNIQTKATDTQIVKSLKSYFIGRVMGLTDVVVYDPLFNDERVKADEKLKQLKQKELSDEEFKIEIAKLQKSYQERGLYRKFKAEVVAAFKQLPEGVSLGLSENSKDENGVDWNNLSRKDLDRADVQEVLVAAAMAQIYSENKGEWIDTSNPGLDRYVFNSLFYGMQIPKSIFQNFVTYQILCMGQDNAKMSFAKAVLFNVTTNFLVNQVLYGYREKAINQ